MITKILFAFAICVGFGLLFGYIVAAISNESIHDFDSSVIEFVQGTETPWLTIVMKLFTMIGSWTVVVPVTIIACALLYFRYHYRQQAYLFATVVVGSIGLNTVLKLYFKRERPEIYRMLDATGFSFPSGHTMMAFSLYTIIAYVIWRNATSTTRKISLVLFVTFMTFMIAVSRIYLGVHFPSDIIGGIAVSAMWGIIVVGTFQFFGHKRRGGV